MSLRDSLTDRTIAGKYIVKERLGSGGMGAVYRARHVDTGGDVAVKFLHGTASGDEKAVKRFQLEAQNAAQLRSTNTIRIIDFGVDDGVFYLVMEYLHGRSLAAIIRDEGPLPWRRAVHVASQVLKSLWEAHEHARKIIHRDIKPANIVLVDLPGETDVVRVLDFGIARSLAGSGAGTQGVIGTPFYMAPELWKGELVDARTDLYALGCVMFEMLVGAPPFQPPPSATEILLPLLGMHCHDDPPPTLEAAPNTPVEVAAWVDGLLRKDKDARPTSAREALASLEAAAATGAATKDPAVTPTPPPQALAVTQAAPDAQWPPVAASTAPARSTSPGSPRSRTGVIVAAAIAAFAVLAVVAYLVASGGGDGPADPKPTVKSTPTPTSNVAGLSATHTATSGPLGTRVMQFRARLSWVDHRDDAGRSLVSAAEIVAQDRRNYHSEMNRDAEDEGDLFFTSPEALTQLVDSLEVTLEANRQVAHAIIHGTPLVELAFYENGVRVTVISE